MGLLYFLILRSGRQLETYSGHCITLIIAGTPPLSHSTIVLPKNAKQRNLRIFLEMLFIYKSMLLLVIEIMANSVACDLLNTIYLWTLYNKITDGYTPKDTRIAAEQNDLCHSK